MISMTGHRFAQHRDAQHCKIDLLMSEFDAAWQPCLLTRRQCVVLQQLTGRSQGSQLTRIPLQAWLGTSEGSTEGLYSMMLQAAVLDGTVSSQQALLAQQPPGRPLCLMPEFTVRLCRAGCLSVA